MVNMSIGAELWRGLGIAGIVLAVGIVLAIIGIQHEYIVKLNVKKSELEIINKDLNKRIEANEKEIKQLKEEKKDLEDELAKFDKKRARQKKKEEKEKQNE